LKIQIDNLEFNSDYFYIQTDSIVEKISFNNRTLYSKYRKNYTPLNPTLLKQHQDNELTLALPLIENNCVNYLVIEYFQEDWRSFYALIKNLFKTLNIEEYSVYQNSEKTLLQIFILTPNTALEVAYKSVEEIKHHLKLKSKNSYKLYPNKNLPKNYNIITFPYQKI